ncbi:MAG: hypothetical protein MZV63_62905 [Marinilabiliales bacterium]|nr:hypothetical protein [Marinilabiliales bacterium]
MRSHSAVTAALGHESVRHRVHNNMITINGQKSGTVAGEFLSPSISCLWEPPLATQPFSPMTIRFFIPAGSLTEAPSISPDEALQAAGKGLKSSMSAAEAAAILKSSDKSTTEVESTRVPCYDAMNRRPQHTGGHLCFLFDAAGVVNAIASGKETLNSCDLRNTYLHL